MAKHTPGPWALDVPDGPWARDAYVRAPSWGAVARVGLDGSLPHWDEPQRANARLIAAAPELLEMLKEAAEVLEHCRYSELPMAQKCRALIARCTST